MRIRNYLPRCAGVEAIQEKYLESAAGKADLEHRPLRKLRAKQPICLNNGIVIKRANSASGK